MLAPAMPAPTITTRARSAIGVAPVCPQRRNHDRAFLSAPDCGAGRAGLQGQLWGNRPETTSRLGWPGLRYSEAPARDHVHARDTGASEYLSPGHPRPPEPGSYLRLVPNPPRGGYARARVG